MGRGGPRPAYQVRVDGLHIAAGTSVDAEDTETNVRVDEQGLNHLSLPYQHGDGGVAGVPAAVSAVDGGDDDDDEGDDVERGETLDEEPAAEVDRGCDDVMSGNNAEWFGRPSRREDDRGFPSEQSLLSEMQDQGTTDWNCNAQSGVSETSTMCPADLDQTVEMETSSARQTETTSRECENGDTESGDGAFSYDHNIAGKEVGSDDDHEKESLSLEIKQDLLVAKMQSDHQCQAVRLETGEKDQESASGKPESNPLYTTDQSLDIQAKNKSPQESDSEIKVPTDMEIKALSPCYVVSNQKVTIEVEERFEGIRKHASDALNYEITPRDDFNNIEDDHTTLANGQDCQNREDIENETPAVHNGIDQLETGESETRGEYLSGAPLAVKPCSPRGHRPATPGATAQQSTVAGAGGSTGAMVRIRDTSRAPYKLPIVVSLQDSCCPYLAPDPEDKEIEADEAYGTRNSTLEPRADEIDTKVHSNPKHSMLELEISLSEYVSHICEEAISIVENINEAVEDNIFLVPTTPHPTSDNMTVHPAVKDDALHERESPSGPHTGETVSAVETRNGQEGNDREPRSEDILEKRNAGASPEVGNSLCVDSIKNESVLAGEIDSDVPTSNQDFKEKTTVADSITPNNSVLRESTQPEHFYTGRDGEMSSLAHAVPVPTLRAINNASPSNDNFKRNTDLSSTSAKNDRLGGELNTDVNEATLKQASIANEEPESPHSDVEKKITRLSTSSSDETLDRETNQAADVEVKKHIPDPREEGDISNESVTAGLDDHSFTDVQSSDVMTGEGFTPTEQSVNSLANFPTSSYVTGPATRIISPHNDEKAQDTGGANEVESNFTRFDPPTTYDVDAVIAKIDATISAGDAASAAPSDLAQNTTNTNIFLCGNSLTNVTVQDCKESQGNSMKHPDVQMADSDTLADQDPFTFTNSAEAAEPRFVACETKRISNYHPSTTSDDQPPPSKSNDLCPYIESGGPCPPEESSERYSPIKLCDQCPPSEPRDQLAPRKDIYTSEGNPRPVCQPSDTIDATTEEAYLSPHEVYGKHTESIVPVDTLETEKVATQCGTADNLVEQCTVPNADNGAALDIDKPASTEEAKVEITDYLILSSKNKADTPSPGMSAVDAKLNDVVVGDGALEAGDPQSGGVSLGVKRNASVADGSLTSKSVLPAKQVPLVDGDLLGDERVSPVTDKYPTSKYISINDQIVSPITIDANDRCESLSFDAKAETSNVDTPLRPEDDSLDYKQDYSVDNKDVTWKQRSVDDKQDSLIIDNQIPSKDVSDEQHPLSEGASQNVKQISPVANDHIENNLCSDHTPRTPIFYNHFTSESPSQQVKGETAGCENHLTREREPLDVRQSYTATTEEPFVVNKDCIVNKHDSSLVVDDHCVKEELSPIDEEMVSAHQPHQPIENDTATKAFPVGLELPDSPELNILRNDFNDRPNINEASVDSISASLELLASYHIFVDTPGKAGIVEKLQAETEEILGVNPVIPGNAKPRLFPDTDGTFSGEPGEDGDTILPMVRTVAERQVVEGSVRPSSPQEAVNNETKITSDSRVPNAVRDETAEDVAVTHPAKNTVETDSHDTGVAVDVEIDATSGETGTIYPGANDVKAHAMLPADVKFHVPETKRFPIFATISFLADRHEPPASAAGDGLAGKTEVPNVDLDATETSHADKPTFSGPEAEKFTTKLDSVTSSIGLTNSADSKKGALKSSGNTGSDVTLRTKQRVTFQIEKSVANEENAHVFQHVSNNECTKLPVCDSHQQVVEDDMQSSRVGGDVQHLSAATHFHECRDSGNGCGDAKVNEKEEDEEDCTEDDVEDAAEECVLDLHAAQVGGADVARLPDETSLEIDRMEFVNMSEGCPNKLEAKSTDMPGKQPSPTCGQTGTEHEKTFSENPCRSTMSDADETSLHRMSSLESLPRDEEEEVGPAFVNPGEMSEKEAQLTHPGCGQSAGEAHSDCTGAAQPVSVGNPPPKFGDMEEKTNRSDCLGFQYSQVRPEEGKRSSGDKINERNREANRKDNFNMDNDGQAQSYARKIQDGANPDGTAHGNEPSVESNEKQKDVDANKPISMENELKPTANLDQDLDTLCLQARQEIGEENLTPPMEGGQCPEGLHAALTSSSRSQQAPVETPCASLTNVATANKPSGEGSVGVVPGIVRHEADDDDVPNDVSQLGSASATGRDISCLTSQMNEVCATGVLATESEHAKFNVSQEIDKTSLLDTAGGTGTEIPGCVCHEPSTSTCSEAKEFKQAISDGGSKDDAELDASKTIESMKWGRTKRKLQGCAEEFEHIPTVDSFSSKMENSSRQNALNINMEATSRNAGLSNYDNMKNVLPNWGRTVEDLRAYAEEFNSLTSIESIQNAQKSKPHVIAPQKTSTEGGIDVENTSPAGRGEENTSRAGLTLSIEGKKGEIGQATEVDCTRVSSVSQAAATDRPNAHVTREDGSEGSCQVEIWIFPKDGATETQSDSFPSQVILMEGSSEASQRSQEADATRATALESSSRENTSRLEFSRSISQISQFDASRLDQSIFCGAAPRSDVCDEGIQCSGGSFDPGDTRGGVASTPGRKGSATSRRGDEPEGSVQFNSDNMSKDCPPSEFIGSNGSRVTFILPGGAAPPLGRSQSANRWRSRSRSRSRSRTRPMSVSPGRYRRRDSTTESHRGNIRRKTNPRRSIKVEGSPVYVIMEEGRKHAEAGRTRQPSKEESRSSARTLQSAVMVASTSIQIDSASFMGYLNNERPFNLPPAHNTQAAEVTRSFEDAAGASSSSSQADVDDQKTMATTIDSFHSQSEEFPAPVLPAESLGLSRDNLDHGEGLRIYSPRDMKESALMIGDSLLKDRQYLNKVREDTQSRQELFATHSNSFPKVRSLHSLSSSSETKFGNQDISLPKDDDTAWFTYRKQFEDFFTSSSVREIAAGVACPSAREDPTECADVQSINSTGLSVLSKLRVFTGEEPAFNTTTDMHATPRARHDVSATRSQSFPKVQTPNSLSSSSEIKFGTQDISLPKDDNTAWFAYRKQFGYLFRSSSVNDIEASLGRPSEREEATQCSDIQSTFTNIRSDNGHPLADKPSQIYNQVGLKIPQEHHVSRTSPPNHLNSDTEKPAEPNAVNADHSVVLRNINRIELSGTYHSNPFEPDLLHMADEVRHRDLPSANKDEAVTSDNVQRVIPEQTRMDNQGAPDIGQNTAVVRLKEPPSPQNDVSNRTLGDVQLRDSEVQRLRGEDAHWFMYRRRWSNLFTPEDERSREGTYTPYPINNSRYRLAMLREDFDELPRRNGTVVELPRRNGAVVELSPRNETVAESSLARQAVHETHQRFEEQVGDQPGVGGDGANRKMSDAPCAKEEESQETSEKAKRRKLPALTPSSQCVVGMVLQGSVSNSELKLPASQSGARLDTDATAGASASPALSTRDDSADRSGHRPPPSPRGIGTKRPRERSLPRVRHTRRSSHTPHSLSAHDQRGEVGESTPGRSGSYFNQQLAPLPEIQARAPCIAHGLATDTVPAAVAANSESQTSVSSSTFPAGPELPHPPSSARRMNRPIRESRRPPRHDSSLLQQQQQTTLSSGLGSIAETCPLPPTNPASVADGEAGEGDLLDEAVGGFQEGSVIDNDNLLFVKDVSGGAEVPGKRPPPWRQLPAAPEAETSNRMGGGDDAGPPREIGAGLPEPPTFSTAAAATAAAAAAKIPPAGNAPDIQAMPILYKHHKYDTVRAFLKSEIPRAGRDHALNVKTFQLETSNKAGAASWDISITPHLSHMNIDPHSAGLANSMRASLASSEARRLEDPLTRQRLDSIKAEKETRQRKRLERQAQQKLQAARLASAMSKTLRGEAAGDAQGRSQREEGGGADSRSQTKAGGDKKKRVHSSKRKADPNPKHASSRRGSITATPRGAATPTGEGVGKKQAGGKLRQGTATGGKAPRSPPGTPGSRRKTDRSKVSPNRVLAEGHYHHGSNVINVVVKPVNVKLDREQLNLKVQVHRRQPEEPPLQPHPPAEEKPEHARQIHRKIKLRRQPPAPLPVLASNIIDVRASNPPFNLTMSPEAHRRFQSFYGHRKVL